MKPAVGQIIHFYTRNTAYHQNGQGLGPYSALVLQSWEGPYLNLKVFGVFAADHDEGSVEEKKPDASYTDAVTGETVKIEQSRWWEWPPQMLAGFGLGR